MLEKDAAGEPQRLLVTVADHVVSLARGPQVSGHGLALGALRETAPTLGVLREI